MRPPEGATLKRTFTVFPRILRGACEEIIARKRAPWLSFSLFPVFFFLLRLFPQPLSARERLPQPAASSPRARLLAATALVFPLSRRGAAARGSPVLPGALVPLSPARPVRISAAAASPPLP